MKNSKNLVAAIILAFLLGPLGLFYSSTIGGLVMLLGPMLLAYIHSGGDIAMFIGSYFAFGILGFAFYWPICIIWAAVSTVRYNNRVIEENRFQLEIEQSYESTKRDNKMVEWLKQNPTKGINDYYSNNH